MTPVTYAWPWNAPRQAISCPGLTHRQQQHRDRQNADLLRAQRAIALLPECIKREIYRHSDGLESREGSLRANAYLRYVQQKVVPRIEVVTQRWGLASCSAAVSQTIFHCHFDTPFLQFLASRLVNMIARYNRLPDMNRADVNLLAKDIAFFIRAELADIDTDRDSELKTLHRWYMHAAFICQQFNVTPPHWQRITRREVTQTLLAPAVMRMFSESWWRGRLQRVALQWREHLFIAFGSVSKRRHPFVSSACLRDWREQKRRTRDFLKDMELEDEEGHRISLIEKYDRSQANPAIRRCELMTRIRGFETLCQQSGYIGEFCTLTAPSKYHATLQSGYRNQRWNGASPADTQGWFNRLWARIRARLHRQNIRLFGIRVAEPHHDGTPHWHLLLFLRPEQKAMFRQIMSDYAMQEDAETLGSENARRARFHSVTMDASKGSATGYLAKYIAKNIDGYALEREREHESGRPLKETAAAVTAWANRWHIRQFQFIGGAPVTIYRELRRLSEGTATRSLSVTFAAAHAAADSGDWAGYVNAQGGPFVRRDALPIRALYLPYHAHYNRYGEEIISVRGVYDARLGADLGIITRTRRWTIVPRRRSEENITVAASPWSSVINCTPPEADIVPQDLTQPLNRSRRRKLTLWLRHQRPRNDKCSVINPSLRGGK